MPPSEPIKPDPFLRAIWVILAIMALGIVAVVSWVAVENHQLLESGKQDTQILQEFCQKYHVKCEPSVKKVIVVTPTTLPVHTTTTTSGSRTSTGSKAVSTKTVTPSTSKTVTTTTSGTSATKPVTKVTTPVTTPTVTVPTIVPKVTTTPTTLLPPIITPTCVLGMLCIGGN